MAGAVASRGEMTGGAAGAVGAGAGAAGGAAAVVLGGGSGFGSSTSITAICCTPILQLLTGCYTSTSFADQDADKVVQFMY